MKVLSEPSSLLFLAADVAACYQVLPQVEAVALGDSLGSGIIDVDSDVDLYIYVRSEIPVPVRLAIALARSRRAEVNNRYWELGDEWVEADTGVSVDLIFRDVPWIEEQLDRVLRRHEASVGYSTCLWHNVRTSQMLVDRRGWFVRSYSRLRRSLIQSRSAEQLWPRTIHFCARRYRRIRTSWKRRSAVAT